MKIGIFGGSFNPIHKGHVEIAKEAIKVLDLDTLYFVPAYASPFKTKIKYAKPEHRVAMISLVKPEKSSICLFEIKRKGISYTIDTVSYFRQKFPTAELFLILGSDNLSKLNKWKQIERIATETQIVIFKRSDKIDKTNVKKYNCKLLNNELYKFSSSEFQQGIFEVAPLPVREYIGKNFLYVLDILKNSVEAKRNKHCLATASLAAQYAKVLKYDPQIAWIAGLLHDITKNIDNTKQRAFLTKHGIDEKMFLDYQLHQTTGSIWLEKEYLVQNPEIVKAVSCHTSLAKDLSVLDKIVFMADKLCEGRKFEGIQKIRELAFQDFETAFKIVVQKTWDFNCEKNVQITPEQIFLYKKWVI